MQSVLIIRANRGVGFAFAKAYLEQGSQVFAAYRNAATSRRLLELEHPNLVPLPLEVTDFPSIQAAVQTVQAHTSRLVAKDFGVVDQSVQNQPHGEPMGV